MNDEPATQSWMSMAEVARAGGRCDATLRNLQLAACYHAARLYRASVLTPWVKRAAQRAVGRLRACLQSGMMAPESAPTVWRELELWDGSHAEAVRILDAVRVESPGATNIAARVEAYAAADHFGGSANFVDAAVFAHAVAYAVHLVDAATNWDDLCDLCARLDAVESDK